jgi:hypothetical protein
VLLWVRLFDCCCLLCCENCFFLFSKSLFIKQKEQQFISYFLDLSVAYISIQALIHESKIYTLSYMMNFLFFRRNKRWFMHFFNNKNNKKEKTTAKYLCYISM